MGKYHAASQNVTFHFAANKGYLSKAFCASLDTALTGKPTSPPGAELSE
jgi:hypothetical protein